jgi:hypothetical protein
MHSVGSYVSHKGFNVIPYNGFFSIPTNFAISRVYAVFANIKKVKFSCLHNVVVSELYENTKFKIVKTLKRPDS